MSERRARVTRLVQRLLDEYGARAPAHARTQRAQHLRRMRTEASLGRADRAQHHRLRAVHLDQALWQLDGLWPGLEDAGHLLAYLAGSAPRGWRVSAAGSLAPPVTADGETRDA